MWRAILVVVVITVLTKLCHAADVRPDTYLVGVAEVDITPKDPVRQNGFGSRRDESTGVNHPIHARALAIRHPDDTEPLLLITVDVLGITAEHRAELVKRLKGKVQPERLAITATHTHCGPMVSGANPTLFGVPIPDDHQKHIDAYTKTYLAKLEEVALAALQGSKPSHLYWGVGSVGFARNRRPQPNGPSDHDLPVLFVKDAETAAVRAVYAGYACHCTILSHLKISGDWAGYAAAGIAKYFPGAVGMISIGCGADQNADAREPTTTDEAAIVRGRLVADEVKRLAGGFLAPIHGKPACMLKSLSLSLADHPDRKAWEKLAEQKNAVGHHARVQLAKLDRGEKLMTAIDYPIQTWAFGDSLAMVHLPGEVVVDYSLRLKSELDRSRVWITAYANNAPCYIPSERVLKEGGYEGGGAMIYYDVPTPFKPGLEEPIVAEVKTQLPAFAAAFDPKKTTTKPLSPQQSRATMRVGPKLVVDLVAAEPIVSDPVAIAFGPDGKLWVAEMLDYPNGKAGKFEPGGRVRFLEDANSDGTFDTATTFLEGLPFPTGVLPWRKGVLICAAPDILYAEDTTGDGKADQVVKLFSGFGTENYQARVNSLCYGLDGWVYGSCGLFGGVIRSGLTGKEYRLGDRDFRIKPDTGEIEPAVGRTQQGRVRNDWGDWFGCDNSNLAWHYPLADDVVGRNRFVAPPPPTVNLSGANQLFAARSPQLFNLSGVNGRTTSACGLGIYRDSKLGAEYAGNTFTCEPVHLVVTRRVLKPNGTTFISERAATETSREFLASTDPWFRPVQATTGPDGGLWVADMYRYVIEHPRWIPPGELAKVDTRAGVGLGRIYRVRPEDEQPKAWPRLDKATTAELVAALDTPNGWQRDMATELLAWRADREAVPLLVKLLDTKRPETRLHALVLLDRLNGLAQQHLLSSLNDPHPGIRKHAVRLAERFVNSHPEIANTVAKQADDPDPQVRLQVAITAGRWADAQAGEVLARIAAKDRADQYTLGAVASSLNSDTFAGFVGRPEIREMAGSPLLPKMIATAVGLSDGKSLSVLLGKATTPERGQYAAWQFTAVESMLEAWQRAAKGQELPAGVVAMFSSARSVATDAKADDDLRAAAVRLLGREPAKLDADIATLASLLNPKTPAPVQAAAVAALAGTANNNAAVALVKGWPGYTPAAQSAVLSALLGRPVWVPLVLENLGGGVIPVSAVSPAARQSLLTSPDAKVRALAQKAFAGAVSQDRVKVIDTYRAEMPKSGDATRGKAVFAKACAACHKVDDTGHTVGPDLAALANKSPDYLLTEILDPSRNLDTRYLEYVAHLNDGRTLTGLLTSESAAAITVRLQEGKEFTMLRADLESFKTSGKSLMPEGLEKDLPPVAMADLLAFLLRVETPPKKLPGNTPAAVTMTGGRAVLPASVAEIRGGDITFESDFGNIGYWHGAKDHATWQLVVPAAGAFDVYIDFACEDASAGNPIALDGGEPTLRSKVIGTGTWANYRLMRLGTFKLPAGEVRLIVRPDTEALKGAMIDLRTVLLVPQGQKPETVKLPATPASDKPEDIARFLLDESVPAADRQVQLVKHLDKAAAILKAMAATLPPDKEGYTTSWMWRVAIASGKRNNADELRAILDVSLPKTGEKLRDWQAVVVGGGVVNGVSMDHGWPGPRIAEIIGKDAGLAERWAATLHAAEAMADHEPTRKAVRYDALRLIPLRGWKASGEQLTKYLAKGTDAELQMGAVSGLVDVDAPEATAALVAALNHLTGTNRELALAGLLRSDDRANALLDAIEKGSVRKDALGATTTKALLTFKSAKVKERAEKVLR